MIRIQAPEIHACREPILFIRALTRIPEMMELNDAIRESTLLPEPIIRKYADATRAVRSLRPDYSRGLSHLIDCAEILLQFGAATTLCALSRPVCKPSIELAPAADYVRNT